MTSPVVRSVVYWGVSAPALAETAVGAWWDLARTREVLVPAAFAGVAPLSWALRPAPRRDPTPLDAAVRRIGRLELST